ncbi:hypothetical protein N8482_02425, partial [Chitinophagales bacterium]|nr:hypothetical protein [Chitinophagales bacterium]
AIATVFGEPEIAIGASIFAAIDCIGLSENFITIIKNEGVDCFGCLAEAGTAVISGVQLCAGDPLFIEAVNENLDGFSQYYIVTDDALNILANNTSGIFNGFDAGSYTMHSLNLSDEEGPIADDALVGLNAVDVLGTLVCYDLETAANPLIILNPIETTITYGCSPEEEIIATITITGGLPELDNSEFLVTGDLLGTYFVSEPVSIEMVAGDVLDLQILDNAGCLGLVMELVPDVCEPFICEAEAGTLDDMANIYCAGSAINLEATAFNGNDDYELFYLLTQAGIITAANESGNFEGLATGAYTPHALSISVNESPGNPAVLIGSNAAELLGQLTCVDLETGNDQVILKPIDIDWEYVCDETTGIYDITYSVTGGLPEWVNDNGSVGLANEESYTGMGDVGGSIGFMQNITVEFVENSPWSVQLTDEIGCSAADGDTPSPCTKTSVEFLSLKGEMLERTNLLSWATASEDQSAYFILERSVDGLQFAPIGQIEAAGNSNTIQEYSLTEEQPATLSYYRVSQVDQAGIQQLSNVIRLERKETSQIEFITSNDQLVLDAPALQGNLQYSLYAVDGRKLLEGTFIFSGEAININTLPAGMIILHWFNGQDSGQLKIVH